MLFTPSLNNLYLMCCRYNFEEVLINSSYNLYWYSICCTIWTYFNNELCYRHFYCVHLNAPGKLNLEDSGWCLNNVLKNEVLFVSHYSRLFFYSSFHHFQKLKMNRMVCWNCMMLMTDKGTC